MRIAGFSVTGTARRPIAAPTDLERHIIADLVDARLGYSEILERLDARFVDESPDDHARLLGALAEHILTLVRLDDREEDLRADS